MTGAAALSATALLAACAGNTQRQPTPIGPTATPDALATSPEINRDAFLRTVETGLNQMLTDPMPEGSTDPMTGFDRTRVTEVLTFINGLRAGQDPATLAGYENFGPLTRDEVSIVPLDQTAMQNVGNYPVAASLTLQGNFAPSNHDLTLSNGTKYDISEIYELILGLAFNTDFAQLDSRFIALSFAKEYFTLQAFLAISTISDKYHQEQYHAVLSRDDGSTVSDGAKMKLILDVSKITFDSEIWTAMDNIPYIVLENWMNKLKMTLDVTTNEMKVINALSQIPRVFSSAIGTQGSTPETITRSNSRASMDALVHTIFIDNRDALFEEIWPNLKAIYFPNEALQATPTPSGNLAPPSQ